MKNQHGFAGATPAQQALAGYWHERKAALGEVRRGDIDPGALRAFLSSISILDVNNAADPVFRIAGTALRDILGMEARGRSLSELPKDVADSWSLGLDAARNRRGPVGGIMRQAARDHAWLRLPLLGSAGTDQQILCHDQLVSIGETADMPQPNPQLVLWTGPRRAA